MAKRTTRKNIIQRLEAAASLVDRAEDKLAQASGIYFDNGAKEGAQLDLIREGLKLARDTIRRFRRETA
jgi:hypothetical protein